MSRLRIIICMLVIHTLFGCKQSELLRSYPNYLKTLISVDLSATEYTFEDDLLSYNVIFYPIDDGIMPLDELEPQSFRIQKESDFEITIAPGDYQVVMYSDYSGQNAFYSKETYGDIYCEAQSQATLSGNKSDIDGVEYAAEPDPLVVANMDLVTIEDRGQGTGLSGQTVTFAARQVTTRLKARVWLTNPRSVSSYTGHVGCVDSRYYLTQDQTNMGGYGISFTSDNSGLVTMSGTNSDGVSVGYLNIQVEMFGFTQRNSTKYTDVVSTVVTRALNDVAEGDAYLYIDIDLPGYSDVQTEFKFDISEYINALERGEEGNLTIDIGSSDETDIVLPEMINDGGDDDDGGFDVNVGDWAPEDDYVLDFGSGTVSKQ